MSLHEMFWNRFSRWTVVLWTGLITSEGADGRVPPQGFEDLVEVLVRHEGRNESVVEEELITPWLVHAHARGQAHPQVGNEERVQVGIGDCFVTINIIHFVLFCVGPDTLKDVWSEEQPIQVVWRWRSPFQ